jgi:integrase
VGEIEVAEANRIAFTQAAVERLAAPADGRQTYWDRHLPGFGLRVSPPRPGSKDGRKTWIAMGRVAGKPVMVTLGTLGQVPKVDAARDLAREALRKMAGGTRPLEERKAEHAAREATIKAEAVKIREDEEGRFDRVAERFLRERAREEGWSPRYAYEVERIFRVDLLPAWGERSAKAITTQDILSLLHEKAGTRRRGRKGKSEGAAVQANRVLTRLATFFAWAAAPSRRLVESNPTVGIPKLVKERSRDRVLSEDEVIWFWRAAEREAWPFGRIAQLLLLTAQREGEVAGMRWSELDLDKRVWTLPRERTKSDRAHVVHLSEPAMEILGTLPRIKGDLVFPTSSGRTISSFSRAKDRIDELMAAQKREAAGDPKLEHWVLHDLRRTAVTIMADKLKVSENVADRVLNHVSSRNIGSVARVYQRGEFLEERQAALEALGRYIASLVKPNGTGGNVVDLVKARA